MKTTLLSLMLILSCTAEPSAFASSSNQLINVACSSLKNRQRTICAMYVQVEIDAGRSGTIERLGGEFIFDRRTSLSDLGYLMFLDKVEGAIGSKISLSKRDYLMRNRLSIYESIVWLDENI